MSTKHTFTPGPWRHTSVPGGWDGVADSQGAIICNLGVNQPANATLIAAAPDLLEACEHALKTLRTNVDPPLDPDDHQFYVESQRLLLAARSKAIPT